MQHDFRDLKWKTCHEDEQVEQGAASVRGQASETGHEVEQTLRNLGIGETTFRVGVSDSRHYPARIF
jgi:hypothetical protein